MYSNFATAITAVLLGLAVCQNGPIVFAQSTTGRSSTTGASDSIRVARGPNRLITGPLEDIDWSALRGRQVTLRHLIVVDTYSLIRHGQLTLARERLHIPTSTIDPNDADPNGNTFEGGPNVAPVVARQKRNDAATIVIDDTTNQQDVFPPPLIPTLGTATPTVRIGSMIPEVTGRVTIERGRPVLRVNRPLNLQPAPRPPRPDLGDNDWTIASFNVLNFFTTIDDGRNKARGADSPSELTRQRDKIVAAMVALDADVIGLMELQNDDKSEIDLVSSLNRAIGDEIYVGCGRPAAMDQFPGGGDSIRVGMIYRRDRVRPVGPAGGIHDEAFARARMPIVQTFLPINRRGRSKPNQAVTVIVNHFKSKGGASSADVANKDRGDGQAAYNATRRDQALAIVNYIHAECAPDQAVLVIGDLNAYSQEDPIDALRAGGLIDLTEIDRDPNDSPHYSFIYYGQSGSLDHALATKPLAERVTAAKAWHINSDEPTALDYNQEYNPPALYQPDPYRSSDHDPLLIGIKN